MHNSISATFHAALVVWLLALTLLVVHAYSVQQQEIQQLQARPCFAFTPNVPYPYHPVPCTDPAYLSK